jgi:RNA polymerase sigma-70 factor (ECF subfamily)
MGDRIADVSAINGFERLGNVSVAAMTPAKVIADAMPYPARFDTLRAGVVSALDSGEVVAARRLMDDAFKNDPAANHADEWTQFRDVTAWSDAWLIAAVRRDPSDEQALDALVDRYWKPLFGRCQMLTLNHQRASDLAQEAWCRVLRARRSLKPDGNFPAYLTTVATNLWRDSNRSARRAGPMAEHRLASLDAPLSDDEGETVALVDVLPDLNALQADEQRLLAMDIDRALEALSPLSREVLVARYLVGESCAEIGRRYGRTEQTVSGWVREALRQVKSHLEEPEFSGADNKTNEN